MARAALLLLPAGFLTGCTHHRASRSTHPPLPPLVQAPTDAPPLELLVDRQKKVVMGRPGSVEQIAQVARETGPILREAITQESLQNLIKQDAAGAGMSVDDFKNYFIRKQEADILLESGGDPNAVSPAGAAGVAQWLAVTGKGRGRLKIDAVTSRLLTAQIGACVEDVRRLRTEPPTFTEVLPPPAPVRPVIQRGSASRGGQPPRTPVVANHSDLPDSNQSQITGLQGQTTARHSLPVSASSDAPVPNGGPNPPHPPLPRKTPTPADGPSPSPDRQDLERPRDQSPPSTTQQPVAAEQPDTPDQPDAPAPPLQVAQTPADPSSGVPPANSVPTGGQEPGAASSAPGAKVWTRDELISARQQQVRDMIAQRRLLDERFDPQKALFAQTRYLIWMWKKYPSLDWVFEAYHGGEEGVEHTLKTYLGDRWKAAGSVTHAILGQDASGRTIGQPISYSDIFFATTPRRSPAVFAYLYGLHDEHRTYWFKLLMAERAIAWYRKDPKAFEDECAALRPGYSLEYAWYPDIDDLVYPDTKSVLAARDSGALLPLAGTRIAGVTSGNLPFIPASTQADLALSRPETLGVLKLVSALYRQESLRPQPLVVTALTQPADLAARIRTQFPLPAPKTTPEPGTPAPSSLPDLHTAGLALDILKPADPWEDRVLQFALSFWEDRERISYKTETWGNQQAWRIVPNPAYHDELAAELKKP